MIAQGDIWWADLGDPVGSAPGYRRPVVIVQSDDFNRSRIATVVCVPLTGTVKWAATPGNVLLPATSTGLHQDSVAQASLIVAIDRSQLIENVGRIEQRLIERVLAGINIVLSR